MPYGDKAALYDWTLKHETTKLC